MSIITQSDRRPLKSHSYFFKLEEKGIELLTTSEIENGNYSNIDIYLLFQFADNNNIDLISLIRSMMFNLSQSKKPDLLADSILSDGRTLFINERSCDKTIPTGMLKLISQKGEGDKNREVATSNYFKFLSVLMEEEKTLNKPMKEESRSEISSFLIKESEKAIISNENSNNRTGYSEDIILNDDFKKIIEEDSPLAYALMNIDISREDIIQAGHNKTNKIGTIELVDEEKIVGKNEEVKEIEKDIYSSMIYNILVPFQNIDWEGIPDEAKEIAKSIFSIKTTYKMSVKHGGRY